jgi:hypothetical protein
VVASQLVGVRGGLSGPLNNSLLVRQRLANNYPIIPHHNALDLLQVWKDAQLIDSLGGHEDLLVGPQFIREASSFLKNSTGH